MEDRSSFFKVGGLTIILLFRGFGGFFLLFFFCDISPL